MPNHYTNIAICLGYDWDRMGEDYEFNVDEFNERHGETNFCSVVMPMPEPIEQVPEGTCNGKSLKQPGETSWYEWAKKHWGTKWGTYDTKAVQLGGDSAPVIISFESAWGPPAILDKIAEWLMKTYGFTSIEWLGCDPYDDSIQWPQYAN